MNKLIDVQLSVMKNHVIHCAWDHPKSSTSNDVFLKQRSGTNCPFCDWMTLNSADRNLHLHTRLIHTPSISIVFKRWSRGTRVLMSLQLDSWQHRSKKMATADQILRYLEIGQVSFAFSDTTETLATTSHEFKSNITTYGNLFAFRNVPSFVDQVAPENNKPSLECIQD